MRINKSLHYSDELILSGKDLVDLDTGAQLTVSGLKVRKEPLAFRKIRADLEGKCESLLADVAATVDPHGVPLLVDVQPVVDKFNRLINSLESAYSAEGYALAVPNGAKNNED